MRGVFSTPARLFQPATPTPYNGGYSRFIASRTNEAAFAADLDSLAGQLVGRPVLTSAAYPVSGTLPAAIEGLKAAGFDAALKSDPGVGHTITSKMRTYRVMLLLLSCTRAEPPAPAGLPAQTVMLGPVGASVQVDAAETYAVYERPGRWVIDFQPGHRQPRQLSIAPAEASATIAEPDGSASWAGGSARWTIDYGGGGSGGPEWSLDAIVSVDGRRWAVSCFVQDEPFFGEVDGMDWCRPAMESLTPLPLSEAIMPGPGGRLEDPLETLKERLSGEQSTDLRGAGLGQQAAGLGEQTVWWLNSGTPALEY